MDDSEYCKELHKALQSTYTKEIAKEKVYKPFAIIDATTAFIAGVICSIADMAKAENKDTDVKQLRRTLECDFSKQTRELLEKVPINL